MKDKFRVLLLEPIDEKGIELLEQKADISYIDKHDEENLIKALADKDGVIKRDRGFITKNILKCCPNLKVVGRHGTGLDTIDVKGAEELGIYVVNTPYANVEAVAEHNIGLMLAVAKSIVKVDAALREGNWDYGHYLVGSELLGKKAGFIGLGKVGFRTAEICRSGFNMDIFYNDIIRNRKAEEKLGAQFVGLEELCRKCDYVLIAIPLTKETEKFFGKDEFELMKPSAFFINAARGPIVDEEALVDALRNRRIAGAGIDAFAEEPPAKDNPLFELDNVVVTPHSASITRNALIGMAMVVKDVVRVLEGKDPKYPANNPNPSV